MAEEARVAAIVPELRKLTPSQLSTAFYEKHARAILAALEPTPPPTPEGEQSRGDLERMEKALRAIVEHTPEKCPSFHAYDVVRRVAWLALKDCGVDLPYPTERGRGDTDVEPARVESGRSIAAADLWDAADEAATRDESSTEGGARPGDSPLNDTRTNSDRPWREDVARAFVTNRPAQPEGAGESRVLDLLAAYVLDVLNDEFTEGELDDDANPPRTCLYILADAILERNRDAGAKAHFEREIAMTVKYEGRYGALAQVLAREPAPDTPTEGPAKSGSRASVRASSRSAPTTNPRRWISSR